MYQDQSTCFYFSELVNFFLYGRVFGDVWRPLAAGVFGEGCTCCVCVCFVGGGGLANESRANGSAFMTSSCETETTVLCCCVLESIPKAHC